ncbi:hypothetical protein NPIL_392641 [Nephila pilipes]|uniref:Uncharacterized protein n=1 Tax=Nephila pilipes TaxID=299642 RepID=A0A8X6UL99_NEPPI|nr:hypothetical protein NPIL_392641 [Nephila pilipes]
MLQVLFVKRDNRKRSKVKCPLHLRRQNNRREPLAQFTGIMAKTRANFLQIHNGISQQDLYHTTGGMVVPSSIMREQIARGGTGI